MVAVMLACEDADDCPEVEFAKGVSELGLPAVTRVWGETYGWAEPCGTSPVPASATTPRASITPAASPTTEEARFIRQPQGKSRKGVVPALRQTRSSVCAVHGLLPLLA